MPVKVANNGGDLFGVVAYLVEHDVEPLAGAIERLDEPA
jgi:hypothetical protein